MARVASFATSPLLKSIADNELSNACLCENAGRKLAVTFRFPGDAFILKDVLDKLDKIKVLGETHGT